MGFLPFTQWESERPDGGVTSSAAYSLLHKPGISILVSWTICILGDWYPAPFRMSGLTFLRGDKKFPQGAVRCIPACWPPPQSRKSQVGFPGAGFSVFVRGPHRGRSFQKNRFLRRFMSPLDGINGFLLGTKPNTFRCLHGLLIAIFGVSVQHPHFICRAEAR